MLHKSAQLMLDDIQQFGQLTKEQLKVLHSELPQRKLEQNLHYMKSIRMIQEYAGGYYQPMAPKKLPKSYVLEDCMWCVMEHLADEETGKLPEDFRDNVERFRSPASFVHVKGSGIYYTCYVDSKEKAYFLKEFLEERARTKSDGIEIKGIVVVSDEITLPKMQCSVLAIRVKYLGNKRGTRPEIEIMN